MTESDLTKTDRHTLSRRQWLGGAAVTGVALGGGAIAGGAVASAQGDSAPRREQMLVEVACLGDTFRDSPYQDRPEIGDNRGGPFSVEGWIYPAGTLPSEGFIVTETDSIGRWFCAGFSIGHGERPEPHLNATATFVFGQISEKQLFPPDTLVSSGLGGTSDNTVDSLRPITGGCGVYFGVIGQVGRINIGFNNTVLRGPGVPAQNFLYTFDMLYMV